MKGWAKVLLASLLVACGDGASPPEPLDCKGTASRCLEAVRQAVGGVAEASSALRERMARVHPLVTERLRELEAVEADGALSSSELEDLREAQEVLLVIRARVETSAERFAEARALVRDLGTSSSVVRHSTTGADGCVVGTCAASALASTNGVNGQIEALEEVIRSEEAAIYEEAKKAVPPGGAAYEEQQAILQNMIGKLQATQSELDLVESAIEHLTASMIRDQRGD